MEEVPGMVGSVPILIPYPPESIRAKLSKDDWQQSLESWLFGLEYRLRLPEDQFSKIKLSENASDVQFLVSFLRQSSTRKSGDPTTSPKEALLYRRAYLLLRRFLLSTKAPYDYDTSKLLELLCMSTQVFHPITDLTTTLQATWKRSAAQLSNSTEAWKSRTINNLISQGTSAELLASIRSMSSLVRLVPEAGLTLMTGSDYPETLISAYGDEGLQAPGGTFTAILTEHLYYCFRSLMSDATNQSSLLLDQLYILKSEADRSQKSKPQQPTLCSSLICTTSFIRHLARDANVSQGKRGQSLSDSLIAYRQQTAHLHPLNQRRRRKISKGKNKAVARDEMHMHKAAQISQIHDLFPNLHNGYIVQLLDHFDDDVEVTIASLLEPDSLPPNLQDQTQISFDIPDFDGPIHDLAPRSTPPLPTQPIPNRRNIFDDDEFDKLTISSSKLHRGRRDITKDQNMTQDQHTRSKAAIMAALAAFDSDDDERDDTYDVADVGGTVDQSVDTDSRPKAERTQDQNPSEETLYRAWKGNEEAFSRDRKTRVSKFRQDLKRETGMTDEQIEGWAIMLKKDPSLQTRLDRKYAASRAFGGNQNLLSSSRWQAGMESQDEGNTSGDVSDGRRMGQAQIRGTRNWNRGRGRGGGSTAGLADDAATQAARRRKEQGRGRGGATHNRREGRAKKMGRGMAGAPV